MDIYSISNYYLENKQNKEIHILQFIHYSLLQIFFIKAFFNCNQCHEVHVKCQLRLSR